MTDSRPPSDLAILEEYFEAWVQRDIATIRRIFHPSAIYEIVGIETHRGIDAIEQYWETKTRVQSGITYKLTDPWAGDETVVCIWSASFFRVDKEHTYHVTGIMWLKLKDKRIIHLIECYRTTTDAKSITENANLAQR